MIPPIDRADGLLAEAAAAVASEAQAELLLEARSLHEAELARCGLIDRLRTTPGPVRLDLPGASVRGWVEGVGASLVVVDDGTVRSAVPIGVVQAIRGLASALADERPERLRPIAMSPAMSMAAHARDLVGEPVRLHALDGSTLAATVVAVGADHLDADPGAGAGIVTIPFAALRLMASRSRMGAR